MIAVDIRDEKMSPGMREILKEPHGIPLVATIMIAHLTTTSGEQTVAPMATEAMVVTLRDTEHENLTDFVYSRLDLLNRDNLTHFLRAC